MSAQIDSTKSGKCIAVHMTAPSPLAGEGITSGRSGYRRVRGRGGDIAMSSPLTRLRFAKPPSPTGGEGRKPDRPFIPLPARAERLVLRALQ
jgi:hypothetical protein